MEQINLELTKELKEKLSAYMAITPDNTFKYVPVIYRDKKNNISKKLWPIFILKILDSQEIAEIEDNSGFVVYDKKNPDKTEWHGLSGTKRLEILKKGISNWNNFKDVKGNNIIYSNESDIRILPIALQIELVNAITEQTQLTEDELRSLEF
jgi:hypothetical protein